MTYSYILHTPEKNIKIADVCPFCEAGERVIDLPPYAVKVSATKKNGYQLLELTVSAKQEADVYLSLMGEGEA